MKNIIRKLKEGELELKDPWRPTNKAQTIIVPILAKNVGKREYITLEEAKDKVYITDTGRIGEAKINAGTDKPVFIRGGTILKGTTQERANPYSIIVAPHKSEGVTIHCIHATKGIVPGVILAPSGLVPRQVYSQMLFARDQSATWRSVNNYASLVLPEIGQATLQADDLVGVFETVKKFRKEVEEMLKQIPDYINQVGVVIVDPEGVVGLELYDHPYSWRAFSESILKSFSEALTREDKTGIFIPNMEAIVPVIQSFLDELTSAEEEKVFDKNNAETMIVKTKAYVGEYTKLNGEVIHVSITRREKEQPLERTIRPPILIPSPFPDPRTRRRTEWSPFIFYSSTASLEVPERKLEMVLSALDTPKTWTELREEVPVSKATLASRIKQLQTMNLIDKQRHENGTTKYTLTGVAQELRKRKPKK